MLEGLVANLLNRFLGMYVKNFDPKQLNVGIWSGDVKLRNLELRREALDQLHLPINVVEGRIGELTLSIPWSNLRGRPVKVNIEDVFLLAAPKEADDYDAKEEEERTVAVKLEKLESAELLKERNTEGMSKEEQQKNQSFASSFATAIVDNLQVSIKNVHLRYEDSIATPGHPFAIGLTIKEMSAISTDGDWRPTFIQSTSGTTHKLAVLNSFGVYWNSDTKLFGTGKGGDVGADAQEINKDEMLKKFKDGVEYTESFQYLLKPVSGRAGLELDKTGSTDRPRMKARLLFQELGFILDEDQYRDALMLVDLMHYFIRHQEYKKDQPEKSPKEDAQAWIRFAGKSVLHKIHEHNRRWTWDYFKERRDMRLRYIELFKKKKKEQQMTEDEKKDLHDLEFKLSYEDLRFWRSLARNQLRKENVGVKKPAQKQTWTQWAWGQKPKEDQAQDTEMTEEQRKELYAAIDWDEKKALADSVDLPRETVKLQVESSLRTGSFTLKRDPHGQANEILKLVFDDFRIKALQRPDSLMADLVLGGFRVYDGTTEGTLFPQIVKVKGVEEQSKDEGKARDQNDSLEDDQKAQQATEDEDSLFHLIFEQNPLDESADVVLMLKLKSLEFIHNPRFVTEIVKFFKPPERQMESIGALLETAGASIEEVRQQTRAGLEFALEEHKTINANIDIQAPILIIPESITQESTLCMILDAGHVSLNSELIDKKSMHELHEKRNRQYTEEDYHQLEGLMYDKFNLKLDSTQVLMGPGIEATRAELTTKADSKNMHIIDRINMDFLVEMSIIPKAPDITRFRITGRLPVLHASISDKKYKNLMRLLDVAIPKFEEDSKKPNGPTPQRQLAPAQEETRSKRKSVVLLERRDMPAIDHDSEDEDEKEEPAKQDADDTERPANLHQRNFEVRFTVEKLQASLYKADADDSKKDKLLVELVAEQFGFVFYVRPFDLVAEVRLGSMTVDDHIEEEPLPEFKQIISSKGNNAEEGKDLFDLKFVKVNPESPEFKSTYEGIATNLDVSVSTINLIVTRATLLTLMDFVLATFAGSDDQATNQSVTEKAKGEDEAEIDAAVQEGGQADKIRIRAQLKSIALILNNDGVRLATLSLNSGDVGVFLDGGTMQIKARLGSLSLLDDINQGAPEDSPLRRLIAIEGDDLADFKYQTYDAERKGYPGYDSGIYLRAGSIKVNFLEEPFRKIMEFGVKFGKMQAIFNAARQAAANQATQVQDSASKMHFDIVMKTPILVFPRAMIDDRPRDTLTAYLGEIYASNKFVGVQGQKDGPLVNKLSAGIRHIRLTTEFHYDDDEEEELEMIEKVDLDFKIRYLEHRPGLERPDLEIEGSISPLNLRISQTQMKLLLELAKTIPAAFATEDETEEEIAEELPASTSDLAKKQETPEQPDQPSEPSFQGPELGSSDETWTKMNLVFKAPLIGLELILAKEDEPVKNLDATSLSKFSLNETNVKMRMISDGAMEAELLIHSFTIRDSRTKDTNKFRKIMSLINSDVQQQFMASVSISAGDTKHMIIMLTIDSPRIIVALDYLFAVQAFANTAMALNESPPISQAEEMYDEGDGEKDDQESDMPDETGDGATQQNGSSMTTSFRINIVDAQVILIANPTISNSEAIVLGTKGVSVSQQNATTLQVTKVGMFLCRMDKFETSRLRLLDDFSIQMSMENKAKGKTSSLTSVNIDIEPLVLRLSLRDILLAMQIVSKATASTATETTMAHEEPKRIKEVKAASKAPSTHRKSIAATAASTKKSSRKSILQQAKPPPPKPSVVMKREELIAQIDGIRVILIGDMHELPLLDWSVKKFDVNVQDWSGAMNADTTINTFLNVYNFSKSAWEPLIEPWQLGFHMAKEHEVMSVELYSHKNMELTVTSATIALASKSFNFLSSDEDMLSKPRVADAPYRIRNYTGFDLSVWADEKSESAAAAKLSDGEEHAWRFEDATSMRENLSPEGNAGLVGVKLEGSGFDSVNRIAVIREGETLYNLKPRKDKVQHRMLVEVKLGSDNVKYITFRSPLLVENKTQIPIEIGVFSPEDGTLLKIEKVPPGEGRPAPVGAAFVHSLIVRPDQGFGYGWSNERLFWKDLLKRDTRTITCQSDGRDESPPFFFQMHASYDKKDPMCEIYPFMRIQISAPMEVQNLLPYDFKYRIYDKNTKKDWTNFLRKGGVSPVHVVELSHLLLLSVDLEETAYKQSDFAIINSNTQEDFRREKNLQLKDARGSQLRLKLHYNNIPDSGGAFKVSVYSPYVLLNKTGLDMSVQSKTFFGSSKVNPTQGLSTGDDSGKALPYLYSYPTDDRKNRSLLKIGDSTWSKPQSFDALGSSYEAVLPAASGRSEMHMGVSVSEGEGKYNLSKVVTLTPRFILKNKIGENLELREPGSSEVIKLSNSDLRPVYFMRQVPEKQLCLCFPGANNQWSSPFNLANVGMTHVKLAKHGQRQKLIRVEIILEGATLFVHFSIETKHWPFSMRNESDTEFLFFQANPNVAEDEEEDQGSGWKPIRYKLPPRSIMPYAWDYPASKNKELVLSSGGKERYVKLAEIGNLIPIKLPARQAGGPVRIIDVNIVADGPTQSLVLSNYKPKLSLYRQKTGASTVSQSNTSQGFEVKQIESEVNFKAELRLAGVGISLVNSKLKELLYLTFREIEFKYGDSKLYQTINMTTKWIQIDNQLYGGIFPILLYPSVVPKTGKEMEAHPIFQTSVTRVKDDSYGVQYIKYFSLLLQQITIEIDEDFIFAMLDFTKVPGASWSEVGEGRLCDETVDVPEPTKEEVGQDIYFELLHLQPIQLDLSFVRTERINAEADADETLVANPLMFFVNVMTMSIGNVNDAPIKLNALLLENARISVPALIANIRNHYTQEVLRQVHVILGSADFLGNPVGLFNSVSSGVADIFYEPYQGLVMTDRPQELGIGMAKGASSFVKKSVFGFSDSMAKFTGSISKGLAAATLDKEFQDQRRMSKNRNRPKHALYGVTSGGNAFATSVASGIGGLARHPLEGAEKEGAFGFAKGVGKGILGLATKPAIGAFDLASNVAEGVRNTTTVFDQEGLDRVRLSRFIGMDGIVRPYAQREALGQFWLKTCDDGKYFNEDYIAHLELEGKEMMVLVTYNRLLMVRMRKMRMEWDVKLVDVQSIAKERTGVSVGLKGGMNGPFIPVGEFGSRDWLYKQIAIAVNAFNDRYNAKG